MIKKSMGYIAPLTPEEVTHLQVVLRDSNKHRERMRAQAVLLSHKGYKLKVIADICQVDRDTISHWFTGWEKNKLASLSDALRSGRPSLLNEQEKKVF